jgi:SAM-dependent methyltransferase
MKDSNGLKNIVKEKYAHIAMASEKKSCGCCGDKESDFSVLSLDYQGVKGYMEDADLRLGCGIPTEHAGITAGDRVLDLGAGAGNDCFVARSLVGDSGWVTGLDFTDEMLQKARRNNEKMGYQNVEFVKGDIEQIPLPDNSYDVIISNCVLNLVPDKMKAYAEIMRLLKPGGHFCVSDIVLQGKLPDDLKEVASLYAGCVSGALQKEEYLQIIEKNGFSNIEVKSEQLNNVPDVYLLLHVSQDAVDAYHASGAGIYSITVVGFKS